ncbi:MAG: class I SAM-dependent methyltransferase [Bacteriovoracaceae bacterium]
MTESPSTRQSKDLNQKRLDAALQSKGASGDSIHNAVLDSVSKLYQNNSDLSLLDMGCGSGKLLQSMGKRFSGLKLFGADLVDYNENEKNYEFLGLDFNDEEALKEVIANNQFDVVTSVEVIEHLENPRQYMRLLSSFLKPGGTLIVTTPNPESYTSILSFFMRGYHSAFGPKDYPAHITVVSSYEMNNMVSEIDGINVQGTYFIPNGRIPKLSFKWHSLFPFLRGKRFSDNYLALIQKS